MALFFTYMMTILHSLQKCTRKDQTNSQMCNKRKQLNEKRMICGIIPEFSLMTVLTFFWKMNSIMLDAAEFDPQFLCQKAFLQACEQVNNTNQNNKQKLVKEKSLFASDMYLDTFFQKQTSHCIHRCIEVFSSIIFDSATKASFNRSSLSLFVSSNFLSVSSIFFSSELTRAYKVWQPAEYQ